MQIPEGYIKFSLIFILLLFGTGIVCESIFNYDLDWITYISIIVFYLIILFIAFIGAKKTDNSSSSMINADKKMPLFIAGFSMAATWIGGGYINGTAEYTFSAGLIWVQAPWGYAMSLILGGLFFAKKMWKGGYTTMLDPIREKYSQTAASLHFIPAMFGELFWSAAIMTALGTTFTEILDFPFEISIILSGILVILYTTIGGLWSVAYTDIAQLIILFFGLLIPLYFIFISIGSFDLVWDNYVIEKGNTATFLPHLEALGSDYLVWWDSAFLLMLGGIPWQVYFQRVLAAKSAQVAQNQSIIAGIVCLILSIPAILIGIIGVYSFQGYETPVSILPHVIKELSPTWVASLGLGAICAAVMSSLDSSILSVSSMFTQNIFKTTKVNVQEVKLKMLKRAIVVTGVIVILIALNITSIYSLWYLCSDLVYCLIFPTLVVTFYDSKSNANGVIFGFIVALILRFGGGEPLFGIPAFITYPDIGEMTFPFKSFAMICGLISILIGSRISTKIKI